MQHRPEKMRIAPFSPGTRLAVIMTILTALTMPGASTPPPPQKAPALTPTNAVVAPNPPPPSSFVNEIGQGKDPFFPDSARRAQTNNVTPVVTAPPVLDQLVLKGITGTKNRRFAIINTEVYGAGEVHEVTLAGQRVKLCCEQINEASVVVSIAGQPIKKELKLRQY